MKNTLRFGIIPLLASIVCAMTACGNSADNEEEGEKPGVISVTVVPDRYTVYRGYEQTFIASVKGTADKTVIWSIEQDNLHNDTAISESGTLSVSPYEEQTTLTIKAALAADETKYGTATVSIPAPTVTGVEIGLPEGIVINPWYPANKTIDVNSGKTELFLAKVVGDNFPNQDVTWSISSGTVSPGTSISDEGLLTVSPNEPQNTTFTVRAVSDVDQAKSDIITVTVKPPVINYFRVVPSAVTISPLNPVAFTITVSGSGNIRDLYEIERTVIRSDDIEISQPGSIDYQDYDDEGNPITVPIWNEGTRFEGNTLYMSPFEKFGDYDENDVFTPLPVFTLDVIIKVKSGTLTVSVQEYAVSLSVEYGIVES